MNKKSKKNKLIINSSKCKNKQISNFLSNTNSNENSNSSSCLNERSIKSTTHDILEKTESIFLLSDDEQNHEISSENKVHNSQNIKIDRKTEISKFFNENSNDFETTTEKNFTEKLSLREKLMKTKGKINKKRRGKQTSIKSAFTKNEEVFSDLMAQHSLAENFSPEDIQLALAYSLSEIQSTSIDKNEFSEPITSSYNNKIREKLQQYGFKTTSNTQDYNINYFLPKGKRKTKWANKFTSLTLRCPDKQKQKLEHNIEKFFKTQFIENEFCDESPFQFNISSSFLKNLVPEFDTIKYLRKCPYMEIESNNELFYVTDLFKPSNSKPGSLLRNFKNIPGRDLSPEKPSQNKKNNEILEQNIHQNCYNSQTNEKTEQSIKQSLNLINDKLDCVEILKRTYNSSILINKDGSICKIDKEKKCTKIKDYLFSPECKKTKMDSKLFEEKKIEIDYNRNRAESPDIFEFSDEELSTDEVYHYNASPNKNFDRFLNDSFEKNGVNNQLNKNVDSFNLLENNMLNTEKVSIFENFSSDEENAFTNLVVDLTQNEESILNYENNEKESIGNIPQLTLQVSEEYTSGNDNSAENKTNYKNIKKNISENNNISIAKETFECPELQKTCLNSTNHELITFDDVKIISTSQLLTKESSSISTKSLLQKQNEISSHSSVLSYDLTEDDISIQNLSKNSSNIKNTFSSISSSNNFDDSVIILSDDEVNYSIINSVKKNLKYKKNIQNFNDFIDNAINLNLNNLKCNESYVEILEENLAMSDSSLLTTPKKYNSSVENNDFGSFSSDKINMDEKLIQNEYDNNDVSIISDIEDETFDLNNLRRKYGLASNRKNSNGGRSSACKKSLSESFLKIDTENNFHRYSTLNDFNKLSTMNSSKTTLNIKENYHLKTSFEDFDEFDKLVYGSPVKNDDNPNDFEKLLKSDIKFSPTKVFEWGESFEFSHNGKVYLIKTQNISKPDYSRMDSPTRLKELYKLGLKPLNRKQALTMLEYIYNQTHPLISDKLNVNINNSQNDCINLNLKNYDKKNTPSSVKPNGLHLKDYFWDKLCDIQENNTFEEKNELYIFQTNISKKISMALLPFHIAWSNLVKSNIQLKEAILQFEPIDLQEIYLFFKSIGYRYDPKEMKKFFDNKCVIFRYDLNDSSSNRHTRKRKTKL